MIYDIIQELNQENGSNYKLAVLKKHKDNELLQRVLKMTYDTVEFTYGITMKNIKYTPESQREESLDLEFALYHLENDFATRDVTGNDALDKMKSILEHISKNDAKLVELILGRDLKINIGKTQINKVWKDLITKPTYMRCDTYSAKTAKHINFPAIVQLKADGTYREFNVHGNHVTARSRSGEQYEYPVIFEQMKEFPDGIYTGELTVQGYTDRAQGNGLINSDNPPHDDIILELWDVISHEEYAQARLKDRKNPCLVPYRTRFHKLHGILDEKLFNNISLIPYKFVDNLQEALQQTSEWMNEGFEGAILKDLSGVFKDGTSKQQLKLKLEISAEMRIVGFHEGTKGTKREGKVGSIIFENDEGTIKGRTSGFDDKQLDWFTEHQEDLVGSIIEVQFNDISKSESNDYYALSHPRYIEIRYDKDETDNLEKVFKLREMAMELK